VYVRGSRLWPGGGEAEDEAEPAAAAAAAAEAEVACGRRLAPEAVLDACEAEVATEAPDTEPAAEAVSLPDPYSRIIRAFSSSKIDGLLHITHNNARTAQ
jgi:hypothetical protein